MTARPAGDDDATPTGASAAVGDAARATTAHRTPVEELHAVDIQLNDEHSRDIHQKTVQGDAAGEPWLIALDIDGTVMCEDGSITDDVLDQVERMVELGHEVMIATGRSVAMTLPVVNRLGITPRYIVCSNGAITLKRDPDAPVGYSADVVETFHPREVLDTIRASLGDANYAVEDEHGLSRYTGSFPTGALGAGSQKVEWEDLLTRRATRVVVISPEHAIEDFLEVVEQMGLHKVSYNVGWTAWLDIAPDGVNKSTALERVRELLDIPRERVMAVGDGRNDIEMLTWAAEFGRGVAMGQAPDVVRAAANEMTATDLEDGVARLFEAISPEVA